jgi:hypothetical protein
VTKKATTSTASAPATIKWMPRVQPQIFPYSTSAISAALIRACRLLQIEDLRVHDLRHEDTEGKYENWKWLPIITTKEIA